ncbi:DUF4136 domain-containing protein [Lacibacter sediminis]|uniref:DUF4136 domain-containing protein n=1 Tax=Lacibacter sediminis TaxID=2760713 RepID=A0A7G5XJ32_9BACT|nr:DUF4136 domain-containing protein [Lacibacter sediminis]QNA45485.1 DUF4136 domain-containing protein [Lacibacter sediminis]
MKRLSIAFLPLLTLFLLASCKKNPIKNLTVEESWVYISSGNNGINFYNFSSVTIPDSIILISNRQGSNNYETNALAQSMINEVKATMQSRGYTLTGKNNNPDLGISIARIDNSYTNVAAFNGWWDPYYGYWDPTFWGYPGFGWAPTQFVFYNTTESAWAIDIIDLKNTSGNSLQILWSGTIRGEEIFNSQAVPLIVKGLFEIAPYIKRN